MEEVTLKISVKEALGNLADLIEATDNDVAREMLTQASYTLAIYARAFENLADNDKAVQKLHMRQAARQLSEDNDCFDFEVKEAH